MKTSTEIRAEFLKTLMTEDRSEIRGIRASIYNVTTLLATASFAITAFLLGQKISQALWMCLLIDVLLLVLLWVLFVRFKFDLRYGRQCLVARQNLIKSLSTVKDYSGEFLSDIFPDARTEKPDVTDSELWTLPILTTVTIVLKEPIVGLIVWLQFA
jgi:hypothetical protein